MRPWVAVAVGLTGLLAAMGACAAWFTCECAKLPVEGESARVLTGLAFVGVGLIAGTRQGNPRIGGLMCATGFTWFIGDLGWIYQPLPYTAAAFGAGVFQPVLAHLTLAFPSGWLRTRTRKIAVAAGYLLWLLATLVVLVVWDPADDCLGCTKNLLELRHDPELHDVAEQISVVLALIMTTVVVGLVIQRWYASSTLGRRALGPVIWAVAPLAAAVVGYSLIGKSSMPPLAPLALTALPVGFLVGLLRMDLGRAAVGRLVIELGDTPAPGRLRDALARTLHDGSLQVVYWRREQPSFVDASGQPVALPEAGSGRVATLLERDGEPIAALIHDAALRDDPALIEAAAAAARLAIENERLHAEIRAQLQEVRASRARVVAAADAERRRIERDLHDGSQQRLVTLALALGMARARLGAGADPELARSLREASEELRLALAELRELARGIHPAILTEAGLGPALVSLAERSPVPVTIGAVPDERLGAPVEAAAYFVVAEALTNTVKHARAASVMISARRIKDHLVVEIVDDGRGRADPSQGSGLQGLADRVGALDGRLEVLSPPDGGTRVLGIIPLVP
jgi:signal transduction histidine kinase